MSSLRMLGALVRLMLPGPVITALYGGRLAEVDHRRIDPQAQAVFDLVRHVRGEALPPSVEESREQLATTIARFDQPGPDTVRRENAHLPGAEVHRDARVYSPEGAAPRATLLYLHGGGWVQGSIDTHDALCAKLAHGAGIRVISYDYRLAPEHKFPAAPDDVLAAYLALISGEHELTADPAQLVVGGDSAGANLTAGLMHDLAAGGHTMPRAQLLIYPAVDGRLASRSMQALADNPLLPRARIDWYMDHYLPAGHDVTDPRFSPLFSDHLAGQPEALIVAAGHDPLWDDGLSYTDKLRDADVNVELVTFEGQVHGFVNLTKVLPQGRDAINIMTGWLRRILHG